jgi:hypothetical protein
MIGNSYHSTTVRTRTRLGNLNYVGNEVVQWIIIVVVVESSYMLYVIYGIVIE